MFMLRTVICTSSKKNHARSQKITSGNKLKCTFIKDQSAKHNISVDNLLPHVTKYLFTRSEVLSGNQPESYN